MRKRLNRITALMLSAAMALSPVAESVAYAKDRWSETVMPYDTPWGKVMYDYEFSAEAEAKIQDQGYLPTGLTMEATTTAEHQALMAAGYVKLWVGISKHGAKTISTQTAGGIPVTLNCAELEHQYLSCIADHVGGNMSTKGYQPPFGTGLALENVYVPSDNMQDYPEFITKSPHVGGDINKARFFLVLSTLIHSAHISSDTACKDDIMDTEYSLVSFATVRCIEQGWLADPSADADTAWNAVLNSDISGVFKTAYLEYGYPSVWNNYNSSGAAFFKDCWNKAKLASVFTYADNYDSFIVLTDPVQGDDGKFHSTYDYSALSAEQKSFVSSLSISSSGLGDVTVVNDGSKIDFSAASADSLTSEKLAGASFTANGTSFPKGIAGLKSIHIPLDGRQDVEVYGQERFAAFTQNAPVTGKFRVGGAPAPSPTPVEGDYQVKRYDHKESFTATYNVRLHKYDSETGFGLEGAEFDILESTDPRDISESLTSSDNYYNKTEVNNENAYPDWSGTDDPCEMDNDKTDSDGSIHYQGDNQEAHQDVYTYQYNKFYCGGHTIPEFADIPEPVDDGKGGVANQAEIDAAKELNDSLLQKYAEEVKTCKELYEEGGYFCHAAEEGVEEPSGGGFETKEEYEEACNGGEEVEDAKKDLEDDRDQCYVDFISLKYDYSAEEIRAREGYLLHGTHTDDIPIETKTVTSSELKDFNGNYGGDVSSLPHGGSSGGGSDPDDDDDLSAASSAIQFARSEVNVKQLSFVDRVLGMIESYADEVEVAPEFVQEEVQAVEPEIVEVSEDDSDKEDPAKEESGMVGAAESDTEIISEVPVIEVIEEVRENEENDSDAIGKDRKTVVTGSGDTDSVEADFIEEDIYAADLLSDTDLATPSLATPSQLEPATEEWFRNLFENIGEFAANLYDAAHDLLAAGGKKLTNAGKKLVQGTRKLFGGLLGASNSGSYEKRDAQQGKWLPSEANTISPLDDSIIDHTFIVFDHRPEGEVHINKRDLDLSDSDMTAFDDYREANGDGTLEGAVYGLFAGENIVHPDGHTDVVYAEGDLVAVATTDRNGDASFSAFTVAPGYTWDYAQGTMKATGTTQKPNLHKPMAAGNATAEDCETYIGFNEQNEDQSAPMTEDANSNHGTWYEKHSSNISDIDDVAVNGKSWYPINDNETLNGNCWIGRPLIAGVSGTKYVIRELSRSEGYEISVTGKSNYITNGVGSYDEGASTDTIVKAGAVKTDTDYVSFVAPITATRIGPNDAEVIISGLEPGVKFNAVTTVTTTVTERVPVPYTVTRPVIGTDGAAVIYLGKRVEAVNGGTATLNGVAYTTGTGGIGKISEPEKQQIGASPKNSHSLGLPEETAFGTNTRENFMTAFNTALAGKGYGEPSDKAPWFRVELTDAGILNDSLWVAAVDGAISGNPAILCNRLRITAISGNYAVFRYEYVTAGGSKGDMYDNANKILWKYTPYGSDGEFTYVPFSVTGSGENAGYVLSTAFNGSGFLTGASLADYAAAASGTYPGQPLSVSISEKPAKTYWLYDGVMQAFNNDGTLKTEEVIVTPTPSDPDWLEHSVLETRPEKTKTKVAVTATYSGGKYTVELPVSLFESQNPIDLNMDRTAVSTFTATAGGVLIVQADSGDGDSYVKSVTLKSSDSSTVLIDGETITAPVKVNERPVRQRVAVRKDILLDEDMNSDGTGDGYRDNTFENAIQTAVPDFRFKAYLKSNLERLYRKADGTVTWLDVNGNVMTPVITDHVLTWTTGGKAYDWPEIDKMNGTGIDSLNVQSIYTEVAHETGSKTAGRIANNVFNSYKAPSGNTSDVAMLSPFSTALRPSAAEAIITNSALYSYVGKNTDKQVSDTLRDAANEGYTRILETIDVEMEDGAGMRTVQQYNYEKFFDAIAVANGDKWYDNKPTYTLYKPIGNKNNRKARQISNASRSDRVVQFAIDWYLKDEVSKLTNAVAASAVAGTKTEDEAKAALAANNYQADLYDEALEKAIAKAENYLKPFFRYNLDDIYSLQWDSDENGGSDESTRTLAVNSANTKTDGNDEYVNTSAYLPYGTYIVVEQQPGYTGTDLTAIDYLQKHYQKDRPKEVLVPSVYQGAVNHTTDNYAEKYRYDYSKSNEHWASKDYLIRFGEEWNQNETGTNKHVIRAHSYYGNYEVYPYGLDIDKITGSVSSGAYTGFSVTQDATEPLKDYYDTAHHGEEGVTAIGTGNGGNDSSKWNIESLNAGLEPTANGTSAYDSKNLRDRTFFASISEDAGKADKVLRTGGASSEDNVPGMYYEDGVSSMTGVRTAYDGSYAQMLVPWSVTDSATYNTYSAENFSGYADVNEMNRFYRVKLRLEKLDSETHENILHDGATFQVYKAQRDPATGVVMVYAADTDITGSKEFVTAYCKKNTVMPVDPENPRGEYQGTVAAGTPVCYEADMVTLGDRYGHEVGEFEAFSTKVDVAAKGEMTDVQTTPANYIEQNAGYIEFPEPLGAGVYVLVETVVPSGYVRTKPVAVEIYSDKVTYYKEGNKNNRVIAAIFEEEEIRKSDADTTGIGTDEEATNHKNKPQDTVDVARVFIEDAPIKLTVEKVKESSVSSADTTADKTVTYKVSGRVEGKMASVGGRDDLEYVYLSGKYQGYAYYKGTLEYLAQLKKIYEEDGNPLTSVEIIYEDTLFTGYAYVKRPLETSDDDNKYVTGAKLTLVDAIQLRRNPAYEFGSSDYGDYAFTFPDAEDNKHGLIVERNNTTSNVTRMYVEQGYAGAKTIYKYETDAAGNPITTSTLTGYTKDGKPVYTEGYKYITETIERPDTDILFYDLDSLEVVFDETEDGVTRHYGYDYNKNRVELALLEHDKHNFEKTDKEYSIYAFKGSVPVYEFVGGDFNHISYNAAGKYLKVDPDTVVYHLDEDGNRDSMVDPKTGMAYVIEKAIGPDGTVHDKFLVWATEVYKDAYGNVIARDKITTSRVGTIGENDASMLDVVTDIPSAADPAGGASAVSSAGSFEHKESGSVSGMWKSDAGEESHHETSDRTNRFGQNMNGEMLLSDNNGDFLKQYSPIYDESGNILYYQRSAETYDKGSNLYDRDGDFVRYDNSDLLKEYDDAAYDKNRYPVLYDADQKTEDPATKKLYHRKGEGYVLENTWITSDKTPNDPFEFTLTDGQADVIKRVPEGTYIIEETFVPNGDTNGAYVRAFPVGITVNETTDAQMAKVVEKTTKIEIAKIDGTNRYTLDVLAMDDGARDVGDEVNEKTSYSYGLIGGATLALYKAEKKYTSDYITYPKGYYLVKSETAPLKYHPTNWKVSDPVELTAQWTTVKDEPIYLEGIPQGFYILEEISAPEGFLKAAPIEVEIGTSMEVQEIPVNDDHTKVEVEKVYNAGGTMKQLRGARMELHEAEVDGSGAVQFDADGNPKYKAAKILTWYTSDQDEFKNLPAAFEDMFSAHGINGTSFQYDDDKGNTHTLTRTSIDYSYDWALAGGTALQYPTDARLIFTDEAGRRTRISVFQQRQSGLKITYSYDYEFDWTDITAVNAYCDSYITINGVRRFNYLPIGKKYVVVEAEAPAGYAKALPKLITAVDTPEAQRYIIEDTEARLIISKVLKGKTKEVPGITLSLYRAEAGAFVKDAAHLVETWKTGEDGTYNADDVLFGRMPAGYAKGDLRAHEITGIPAGIYYLYEEEALPYYERFETVKIEYTDLSEVKLIRVENAPAAGEVTLYKKDPAGNYLTGAVYELKRYRAEDLATPAETLSYTDTTGTLVISSLPVGEASETGEVKPYTYTIREIKAPEGYSVVDTLFTFRFDPKAEDGESYDFGDFAKKEYEVIDRKTKFRFQKKDFDSLCDDDTDKAFVDGAAIILYELQGIDVNGDPVYDTAHPIKTVTTSLIEKTVEIEGLIAGKSYVFVESWWPVGWNLMKPVMFTVSADGRKITELTNRLSAITFVPVKNTDFPTDTENLDIDSIASAIIHGRFVTKVEYEIIDAAGAMRESWPAGGIHVISQASGYVQETSYTLLEKTYYSDGTMQITDRLTKPFIFDETGTMKFETRSAEKVELGAYYSDGTYIDGLDPVTDTEFEKTIANSVMPENPVITTTQIGYDEGAPIDQTKLIYDRITFVNPTHKEADAVVTVDINDDTRIVDIAGGTASGNTLTWTVTGVPAFGSTTIDFVTAHEYVNFDAHELKVKVEIAGKTLEAERAVPVVQKNCLTLYNSLTGSGAKIYANEEEEYTVRFWYNLTGAELAGTYSYTGSQTGTMTSGDKITLKANEYVIIDTGAYEDVHYTVERAENGRAVSDKSMEGNFTDALGAYAFSHRSVVDTSVRDIFRKGENYHLIERTTYSDGIVVTTNRLSFAVGENGQADTVIAYDTRTKVAISKTDITDGHEIPGCTLTLYDTNGTLDDTSDDILIEQWVSADKPHMFEGVLESGKSYRLEETSAAAGYAYTEDVLFEVDSDGYIVQKVKMVDKPTDVTINKSNLTTGEPVEGAKLQIIDAGGNIIKEWVTDADGSERFVCVLNADETYTLHEEYSPDGYYYSHDETFTVNHDGTPQMTEMKNREIVVVTPPEEPEQPVEPHPNYEMEKERTSLAPIKMGTGQYGFYHGDTVYYDVTITNTGNMDLRMKVDDAYEHPELFTKPVIDKITFHSSKTTLATPSFGRTHSISGSVGDISIFVGGYAVVTYKAVVKDDTPENLSDHAKDDGMGYLNTARTYDVVGRYIEVGTNAEKTVDKNDFPDELGDKEDDANTPVQEPENPGPGPDKPVTPVPGYIMEKERTTPAPNKKGTLQYGFFHGDTVYYDVTVTNTGNIPLTMDVDDVFEQDTYFSIPKAEKAVFHSQATKASGPMYGTLNSMSGNEFNITIAVGAYAVLTYSAVVMDITPEDLSNHAPDDGMAYLNTAHTYNVVGKYLEEGTDGTITEKTVTKDDYPEELGDKEDDAHTPVQVPEEPTPHYEMDKERVTPAPEKAGTDKFGFHHGDTVTYEVHIENNGDMPLKMYVSDEFEASIARYFLDLHITGITFSGEGSDISEAGQGVGNKAARIRLAVGAKATVTYTAVVADNAPENLSYTAPDDGNGYLNIAKTFNVKAEKPDGTEGDKEEYPGIPDKEDEGNTPVQEPKVYYPRYTMEKERVTPAPLKEGTERYGFFRGDTVEYEVRVTNAGTMPLKIYVSDEFEGTIAKYFKNLHITKIEFTGGTGSDISEAGYGIGKDKARIRIEPGVKAVLTYSAVVSDDAPEFLSFTAPDDGNGYLNIARTYDVKAEKPDGTEGDKHEYPSIPDMKDEGNTPVQEPGKPDDEHPRPYPIIWLLKEGEGDPGIMLQGGTFVLLDADKKPLTGPCAIEEFVMRDFWQEWDIVLRADATYYMHEVTPPRGFAYSEDVSFTVDHYGEDRQVVMIDKPTKVQITKTDITGDKEIPGCELELRDKDGHLVDSWTSGDTPHYIEGKLVAGEEYTLVEVNPAPGYAYAEDITFKVSTDGTIDKVVMKDKVTRVEITKTDITGEKEIPGCILELRDENGIIVDKWTSGSTPHVFEAELIAGKEYTLIEVNPAPGYAYAEDITFRVSKDGTVDKIVMKDKVTHVEISKTDITGGPEIPGAHLIIYDAEGNKVAEWISGTEPHVIEAKLIAGDSYVLREEGAPDGYAYTSDIVFVVSKDGRIDRVAMKDEAIYVEVKKQNEGGTLLSGAVLAVLDKDGKEVVRWTTDGNPKDLKAVLNADTEYTLREISAPSGYKKADDLKFVTPHTGQKFTVTMTDIKSYGGGGGGISYTATLHKFDEETGEELAGAEFTIYYPDAATVYKVVRTDARGYATVSLPYHGIFWYLETEAPEGYIGDEEMHPLDLTLKNTVLEDVPNERKIGDITALFDFDLGGIGRNRKTKVLGAGASRVRTGDDSRLGLWIAILIASGAVLAGAVFKNRKTKENDAEEKDDEKK